jgi:hypothetical protein
MMISRRLIVLGWSLYAPSRYFALEDKCHLPDQISPGLNQRNSG